MSPGAPRPTAPARGQITGLILAGGRGLRMGGADKAWVDCRGRPLIEYVLRRLAPQVHTVLASANRAPGRYAALGLPVVADAPQAGGVPFDGPLAGILAGLRAAATRWVAVVPCDAPGLPSDLVARLAAALPGHRAALARAAGRRQPLFCLLPTDLAPLLEAALANGQRGVDRLWIEVDATEVAFDDGDAFHNLNTAADLDWAAQAAETRT